MKEKRSNNCEETKKEKRREEWRWSEEGRKKNKNKKIERKREPGVWPEEERKKNKKEDWSDKTLGGSHYFYVFTKMSCNS